LAQITSDQLILQAPQHIAWLVSKRLVEGGVNLLVGEVAAGKTYLALDLALGVAGRGVAWGGLDVPRGNVLYYCLDSPSMTVAHRLKGLCQKYAMEAPRGLIFDFERHNLADETEIAALEGLIVEKHIRLVIFDVLARYLSGLNENTALSIGPLMSRMRAICSSTGVSILFVHHFNKLRSTRTGDGERIRGSSEILASMDAALGVTLNGEVRELRSIKNRMGVEAEALGFRIVRQDGEEDAGWLDFDVQVEPKFKMPTLVEMGLENVHTMLKILAGHFYTRGRSRKCWRRSSGCRRSARWMMCSRGWGRWKGCALRPMSASSITAILGRTVRSGNGMRRRKPRLVPHSMMRRRNA